MQNFFLLCSLSRDFEKYFCDFSRYFWSTYARVKKVKRSEKSRQNIEKSIVIVSSSTSLCMCVCVSEVDEMFYLLIRVNVHSIAS